jgi:ribosomal protein L11 methylase PrmA
MIINIITGLCGSGKTHYCKNKNSLSYDEIYSYETKNLNFEKINDFIENNEQKNEIYVDAFNNELVDYIKKSFKKAKITFYFLYTDIDDNYECIAINEPRTFNQQKYDEYISSMINTINTINDNVKNLIFKQIVDNVVYLYRNNNNYIEYSNDEHMNTILNESKKDRLLNFIDKTSGHANYQSIILNSEYIRKGSEQDWITFDNILKCTSLKDKIICDTGCFNGYFSFKSLNEGAKKIIGVDHNQPAISICKKIAIYNDHHQWKNGVKTDTSCESGIEFYEYKIGRDNFFNDEKINTPKIDVIFALNYLHHLKNELGEEAFLQTLDNFCKNSNEIIYEINDKEIDDVTNIASKNNFTLTHKIESHRKTGFGNRWILHFIKNL